MPHHVLGTVPAYSQQLVLDPSMASRAGGYFAKNVAKCAEAVAKDHMPLTYPPEWKEPYSPFLEHLLESGNRFEADIFAEIVSANPEGTVAVIVETLDEAGNRTKEGKEAVEIETFHSMRDPKIVAICGGRIGEVFERLLKQSRGEPDGVYAPWHVSQPDIIVTPGTFDEHGNPSYLTVVDVKDHKALLHSPAKKQVPERHVKLELSNFRQQVAFTSTGSIRVEDCDQLAHYTRHLELLHLADPTQYGWIIGRERVAVGTSLTFPRFPNPAAGRAAPKLSALQHYDYWTSIGREVVINASARDTDPAVPSLTFAEHKSACSECSWRAVCAQELASHGDGGHITLLPGMTPLRAQAHYQAGVTSIRDLARLDPVTAAAIDCGDDPWKIPSADRATAKYAGKKPYRLVDAIWQARAYSAGRVCRAVGVNTINVERADVEVDFDMENSPGPLHDIQRSTPHHGGPLVYLWGVRVTKRHRLRDGSVRTSTKVRQFYSFSDTSDGERDAVADFWRFLTDSRTKAYASGRTWRAFHYSSVELSTLRRLSARYAGQAGVPTRSELEDLLNSGDVVDMLPLLTKQMVWPTKDHSIKSLAKWARFSWRADDAGGDNSIVWYAKSVNGPDKATYRRRLLDYNADDVAAQIHLRDWIERVASADAAHKRFPPVNTLRGPLPVHRTVQPVTAQ